MTSTAKRVLGVAVGFGLLTAAAVLYTVLYLIVVPGNASAVKTAAGPHLYLATVPAAALTDPHPTWVSYYHVSPTDTNWRHDTTYFLPAHTLVTVTIYNFDTATGLRNGFIAGVEGTATGTFQLNGQTVRVINPNLASHIFAIPNLNVSVPLLGVSSNAKNLCSNAPCPLSMAHSTTTIQFRTPGPGLYRWQCFVPCALGFIQGFGGPMQTEGYMDGYIKVV